MPQRDPDTVDMHAFGVACEAVEDRLDRAGVEYIVGDPVLGRREYAIRGDKGIALLDLKQVDGQTVAKVGADVCARSRNASFVGQKGVRAALDRARSGAGGGG